jgi:hypothetical protein
MERTVVNSRPVSATVDDIITAGVRPESPDEIAPLNDERLGVLLDRLHDLATRRGALERLAYALFHGEISADPDALTAEQRQWIRVGFEMFGFLRSEELN